MKPYYMKEETTTDCYTTDETTTDCYPTKETTEECTLILEPSTEECLTEEPTIDECTVEEPTIEECTIEEPTEECPEEETVEECTIEECTIEETTEECPEEETMEYTDCCYTDPALDYLREALVGEFNAVNYYQEALTEIPDRRVQEILCEIMNDEKNHIAHHLYLLAKYDPTLMEEFNNVGWKKFRGEYYRHGMPGNQQEMMHNSMEHMLRRTEQCVLEFMEENIDDEMLENIFRNLPYPLRRFLEDHLDDEDIMSSLAPEIRADLLQHIMRGLSPEFIRDLTEYVQRCCKKYLEKDLQQQLNYPIPGPMGNQIIQQCCQYVSECILCYVLDYILNALADLLEEDDTYKPTCEEPTQEDTEEETEEECPKGEAHTKCCVICPPWLVLIRKAITDELQAISQYRDFITKVPHEDIQQSLCAAMNTEKEHVALLTKILKMCDYAQAEELAYFGWKKNYHKY